MIGLKEGKFKNRYVLGEGFPVISLDEKSLGLSFDAADIEKLKILKVPNELNCETGVPKYRVVLERIK